MRQITVLFQRLDPSFDRRRIAAAAILAVLVWLAGAAFAKPEVVPEEELSPSVQHQQTALIVSKVMERYHYRRHKLDDRMSAEILDGYLDVLDPNRSFFLQPDVDRFHDTYRKRLDNDLRRAKLDAIRTVPDREIVARFPRLVVPTYPGDEEWFGSDAFKTLLPDDWPLEYRKLDQIIRR